MSSLDFSESRAYDKRNRHRDSSTSSFLFVLVEKGRLNRSVRYAQQRGLRASRDVPSHNHSHRESRPARVLYTLPLRAIVKVQNPYAESFRFRSSCPTLFEAYTIVSIALQSSHQSTSPQEKGSSHLLCKPGRTVVVENR